MAAPLALLLGISLALAPPLAQARSLRFVTLLYRHGDRSPVRAYPRDPHQESAWPQGFGQLTQVGMLQQWDLGQSLRKRYHGFLNASYNRQELLKFPLSPCPRYEQLQNETRQSAEYINKTRQNLGFLEMVANQTGIQDVSLESVWSIYDTLFCEQTHRLLLPPWVTPDVMTQLKQLKDFGFEFLFGIHQQMEKARLQGGVLLAQIRKNMTSAANASAPQHLKLLAYSAHDTTLVALQMALNVYNGRQAPYASCHIFELYQDDDSNFSVEMFFHNESGREPFPLTLPGCAQRCPLPDFLQLTDPIIPQDWARECQVASNVQDTELIVALAVCGSILFLLIILLLTVVFRIQSQPPGYRHVSNEGEEQP
ncbi:lysosomal acid phosphatase isoform X3 [Natator depressus]|uniref:lysosomal acid phosphatase isoform X3 n=1 Tax=Natator depressus TaxID=27790 RepID=UPI003EBAF95E